MLAALTLLQGTRTDGTSSRRQWIASTCCAQGTADTASRAAARNLGSHHLYTTARSAPVNARLCSNRRR